MYGELCSVVHPDGGSFQEELRGQGEIYFAWPKHERFPNKPRGFRASAFRVGEENVDFKELRSNIHIRQTKRSYKTRRHIIQLMTNTIIESCNDSSLFCTDIKPNDSCPYFIYSSV